MHSQMTSMAWAPTLPLSDIVSNPAARICFLSSSSLPTSSSIPSILAVFNIASLQPIPVNTPKIVALWDGTIDLHHSVDPDVLEGSRIHEGRIVAWKTTHPMKMMWERYPSMPSWDHPSGHSGKKCRRINSGKPSSGPLRSWVDESSCTGDRGTMWPFNLPKEMTESSGVGSGGGRARTLRFGDGGADS